MAPSKLRLVGHKGADLIAPGNTLASFHAAVEHGVDTIEIDVLWLRDAHLPLEQRAPLVVAHDWADAERRTPLTLTEALDAFLEAPLDKVEINLDIKLPGREEEIVAALRERDLVGRAMVSTMELYSLGRMVELEPRLRRGWTYPKVTRDWTSKPWAKPALPAALMGMRYRLPGFAAEKLTEDRRQLDVGLPPARQPQARPHLQAGRDRADRLDGRRRGADAEAGRGRRHRPLLQRPPPLRSFPDLTRL